MTKKKTSGVFHLYTKCCSLGLETSQHQSSEKLSADMSSIEFLDFIIIVQVCEKIFVNLCLYFVDIYNLIFIIMDLWT